MLAVFCYVYEVTVYVEVLGMKIPYGKEYPFRNLAFVLGFVGILAFGLSIALPSKTPPPPQTQPPAPQI